MGIRLPLASLAFLAASVAAIPSWTQDFRVESDVFVADGEESLSETLTLFSGDVVYDFFVKGCEEITCFDVRRGRIVLLDSGRRVQTTVTTEQLLEFSAAIKKTLSSTKAPESLFSPQFTTKFDDGTGSLELTSQNLSYRAKGIKPKAPGAAQRFRDFADWYARLNAMRLGNLPPFGRLELNSALAERDLVPEEIERVVVVDRLISNKRLRARSRHTFVWTISGTDRKRIEKAAECLASFRTVSLSEYWQLASLASHSQ